MDQIIIVEDGPIRMVIHCAGGHDILYILQHSAEAILRRIMSECGRVAAQGAVPLELQGEEAR